MSETVKLIIEMPKEIYESRYGDECDEKDCLIIDTFTHAIANGIPLDDIDSDETRAYFDGQAYGWEQGRKAMIDDVKAELDNLRNQHLFGLVSNYDLLDTVLEILDNIGKESEEV